MRILVHGSSNSNAPDFVQSSTKRSEASGLLVYLGPFLITDAIPAWKWGAGNCEGRAVLEEDPQTGLAAQTGAWPSVFLCPRLLLWLEVNLNFYASFPMCTVRPIMLPLSVGLFKM